MAEHKTLVQLKDDIYHAGKLIKVGATYMHYKNQSILYVVTGFCITEATDSVDVLYAPVSNETIVFSRPLNEFTETLTVEGKKRARFTRQ